MTASAPKSVVRRSVSLPRLPWQRPLAFILSERMADWERKAQSNESFAARMRETDGPSNHERSWRQCCRPLPGSLMDRPASKQRGTSYCSFKAFLDCYPFLRGTLRRLPRVLMLISSIPLSCLAFSRLSPLRHC